MEKENAASRKMFAAAIKKYGAAYDSGYGKVVTIGQRMVLQCVNILHDRRVNTILDVGCGRGFLLKELSVRGFCVYGTECSPSLFCSDLRGLPVFSCFTSELSETFADQSFDLVLFADLLDHLESEDDAANAIHEASKIVKKGLLVTVNGQSSLATIKKPASWWQDFIVENFVPGGKVLDFKEDPQLANLLIGIWLDTEEGK